MINSDLQSMFGDYKQTNEPTLRITVDFDGDKLVGDLAQVLINEMDRVAGAAGPRLLQDLDQEDVRKYLLTLAYMRRCHVTGSHNKVIDAYRSLKRSVAVPTLWYQVLICIGKALDRDYMIEFQPSSSISESDLLAPEMMLRISDVMFGLQNNGFSVVAGIPKDEEGELAFMAMSHVDGVVKSYLPKSHPVYGFLSSFFATEAVSQALGAMVRVTYGYDADYRTMLSRVVVGNRKQSSMEG